MARVALLIASFVGTATIAVEQLDFSWALISLLINVFFLGWSCHAFLGAYVGGMVRPDERSSKAYIHFFETSHLLFQRAPKWPGLLGGAEEK